MPFNKARNRTPVDIGAVRINLGDMPAANGQPAFQKVTYHLELLDANGEVVTTQGGDLLPHLTNAQKTALSNFLDAMRTKAAEALP